MVNHVRRGCRDLIRGALLSLLPIVNVHAAEVTVVTSMDEAARSIDVELHAGGFDALLDVSLEIRWMTGPTGPADGFNGTDTSVPGIVADLTPDGSRLLAVSFRRVDPTRGPLGELSVEIPPGSDAIAPRMVGTAREEVPEAGAEPLEVNLVAGGLSFVLRITEAAPLPPPATVLAAPWPSPFRYALQVPVVLSVPGRVRVEVFDVLGRRIRLVHDDELLAGEHLLVWDVHTDRGRRIGDGVYFVRVAAPDGDVVHRVLRMGPR